MEKRALSTIALLACLLAAGASTCLHAGSFLSFPRLPADPDILTGIAIVNPTSADAKVTLTAFRFDGSPVAGPGISNPVNVAVPAHQQITRLTLELFGSPLPANTAWFQAYSATDGLAGFFVFLNSGISLMDGADVPASAQKIIFNNIRTDSGYSTELNLINPGATDAHLRLIVGGVSFPPIPLNMTIPSHGAARLDATALYSSSEPSAGAYIAVESDVDVAGMELVKSPSGDAFAVNARRAGERLTSLYFLQISVLGSYRSLLSVVNYSADPVVLTISAFKPDGSLFDTAALKTNPVTRALNPNSSLREDLASMFGFFGDDPVEGWIMVKSTSEAINGFVSFGDASTGALAAVTSPPEGRVRAIFSHIATTSGFSTGLALLNPTSLSANVRVLALQVDGTVLGVFDTVLQPNQRFKRFLGTSDFLPQAAGQSGGVIFVRSDIPVYMSSLIASDRAWVNIPAQNAPEFYSPDASIPPLKMNPPIAILPPGASQLFHVDGLPTDVVWKVNGAAGGTSVAGRISGSGTYSAPRAVPARQVVTVTAEASPQSAGASADILDKVPYVSGLSVIQSVAYLDTLGKVYTAELAALASDPLPGGAKALTSGNSQIFEVSPSAPKEPIASFPGEVISKFVAFKADDGKEYLLLAAQTSGQIIRLNPVSKQFRYLVTGLDQPTSIVIDPTTGDLLVVERERISSIPRSTLQADLAAPGGLMPQADSPGMGATPMAATLSPLSGGGGIVADRCTRNIYVTNSLQGTITEFNPVTGKTRTVASGLSNPGQMLGLYRSEVSCPYSFHILVVQRNANQVSLVLPGNSSVIDWADSSGISDLAFVPDGSRKNISGVLMANQPVEVDHSISDGNLTLVPFSHLYSTAPPNPTTEALVEAKAAISLSQSHTPEPATALETVTFLVTVSNSGPADATGVTVTDIIPSDSSYVSASVSQGSCAYREGIIHCIIGLLRVGNQATISVRVTPPPNPTATSLTMRNTATVTSTEIETDSSSTSTETALVVLRAQTHIEISDMPVEAVAGTTVPVTVSVRDQNGGVVTGYSGRVLLISSDKSAILPDSYVFGAGDSGSHVFMITFLSAGPQMLTIQDAEQGSLSASHTVGIHPASPSKVLFNPVAVAPVAGVPFGISLRISDDYGNAVTGYSGSVALSASPEVSGEAFVPSGSSAGAGDFTVTLTRSGSRTLRAEGAGGVSGATTLTVNPGTLGSIIVSPASASIPAGGSLPFTAEGYDRFNNSLGDATPSTNFSISPDGSCTGAICTATIAGPHTISASNGASTASASITVRAGSLNTVVLSPASGRITAGESQSFTAAGTDQFNNSLGDVTSATTFSISPDGTCAGAACTATVAGPHTVTATNGTRTAIAALTVSAGALNAMVLNPASCTIAAGGDQSFTATGVDQFNNPLEDLTSSTTFTISPDGACTGARCTATVAGPHTVTATNRGKVASASVTVSAGALNTIVLNPATSTISTGGSQAFTAAGFDQFSNPLGNITSSTVFSILPNGSCAGATCTAAISGAHIVTGRLGGRTATASLLVVSSAATGFRVSAPSSITAGTRFPVTVTAIDAAGNTVPSYNSAVTLGVSDFQSGESIVPEGSSAGVYRFSAVLTWAGTRILRATGSSETEDAPGGSPGSAGPSIVMPAEEEDEISGSTSITVVPAGAASLQIAAPATVDAGLTPASQGVTRSAVTKSDRLWLPDRPARNWRRWPRLPA